MPDAQQIEAVVGTETWRDGKTVTHTLRLADGATVPFYSDDGTVPQPGGLAEVKVSKKGKPYAKLVEGGQQAIPQGSSQASGNGDDPYARRPDHPDNAARARHSTAIGATPGFYEFFITCGVLPKPDSLEKAKATSVEIVKWLEGTYPVGDLEQPF